jgi:hypothetical protein
VRYPFGDNWQPDPLADDDFICIDKVSLETPNVEPLIVECESDQQTAPYPLSWRNFSKYNAPIIWYVVDINSGYKTVVSVNRQQQLFQSDGGWLADNGEVAIFQSADPRLQLDSVELLAEEEALDQACLWTLGENMDVLPVLPYEKEVIVNSRTLRVATNDNVKAYMEEDFAVFRETPELCLPTYPPLTRHIFSTELLVPTLYWPTLN